MALLHEIPRAPSFRNYCSKLNRQQRGLSTILSATITSLLIGIAVANISNTSIIREYLAGGNKDKVATKQAAAGGIEILRAYVEREAIPFSDSFIGQGVTGTVPATNVKQPTSATTTYTLGNQTLTIRYEYRTDSRYFSSTGAAYPMAFTFNVTGRENCSSSISKRLCSAYTASYAYLNSGVYTMNIASQNSPINDTYIGKDFTFGSALTVLKNVSGDGSLFLRVKPDPQNYFDTISTPLGYGLVKYGGQVNQTSRLTLSYDAGTVDLSSNTISKEGTPSSLNGTPLKDFDLDLFHDLALNKLRKNTVGVDDDFAKNLVGASFSDVASAFSTTNKYRYKWLFTNRYANGINPVNFGIDDVISQYDGKKINPAYNQISSTNYTPFAPRELSSEANPQGSSSQTNNLLTLDASKASDQEFSISLNTLNNEVHRNTRGPIYRLLGATNAYKANKTIGIFSTNTNVLNNASFGTAWNNQASCGNANPLEVAPYLGRDSDKYDLAWQSGSLMNCSSNTWKYGQTDNLVLVINNTTSTAVSVQDDVTIAAGLVLVKGDLVIPAGKTLTVIGSLAVSGNLTVNGRLEIKPRFYFGRIKSNGNFSSKFSLQPTNMDVCSNIPEVENYLFQQLGKKPRSSYKLCLCGYYRRTASDPNFMNNPTCFVCGQSASGGQTALNQDFAQCITNTKNAFNGQNGCLTQVDTCKTAYNQANATNACGTMIDPTLPNCVKYDQYCGKTCSSFTNQTDIDNCNSYNSPGNFCSGDRTTYCTRTINASLCNQRNSCINDLYINSNGSTGPKCNTDLINNYNSCAAIPACLIDSCRPDLEPVGADTVTYKDSTSPICGLIMTNTIPMGGAARA